MCVLFLGRRKFILTSVWGLFFVYAVLFLFSLLFVCFPYSLGWIRTHYLAEKWSSRPCLLSLGIQECAATPSLHSIGHGLSASRMPDKHPNPQATSPAVVWFPGTFQCFLSTDIYIERPLKSGFRMPPQPTPCPTLCKGRVC